MVNWLSSRVSLASCEERSYVPETTPPTTTCLAPPLISAHVDTDNRDVNETRETRDSKKFLGIEH